MRIKLFFLLFFTSVVLLFSQEPTHYIVGKEIFEGVKLYSITQDKDNSIVISTNQGVYRYDGITFKKLKVVETENVAFFDLTKDKHGNIYCSNFSGEIFQVLSKELKRCYTIEPELVGGSIDIAFDNLNNLLISTNHKMYKIKKDRTEAEQLEGLNGFFFSSKNDTVFFGKDLDNDKTAVVGLYNNKETLVIQHPVDKHLYLSHSKLFHAKKGLLGFEKSKARLFKANKSTFKELLLNINVNKHTGFYYTNNNCWFTDIVNGVYCLSENNLTQKVDKWFNDYYISGVFTDIEGNTWLLTFDNGIIIIPNLDVINNTLNKEKLIGLNKINDEIYVSTKKGEILTFKNNRFNSFFKQPDDRFEYFEVLENDIVVSSTTIYKNKKPTGQNTSYNRKTVRLKDSLFLSLYNGLYSVGLDDLSQRKRITTTRTKNIHLDTLTSKIWISSITGLSVYKDGEIKEVSDNGQPILSNYITNVEDKVWVATSKGIYIFKDEKIIDRLNVNDGLLENVVKCIKYEYPFVYLSYDKGIQQYNVKTNKIKEFTRPNGLTKKINYFEVLNDTIYALTNQGLLTFTFNETNLLNKINYNTTIKEAVVNGTFKLKNKQKLGPEENNIYFSFLTTTHKFKHEVKYTYQLVGYDKKPIEVREGDYHVNYSKVPAGKYTFVVKSHINNIENTPAQITFCVKEYWYKTIWVKFILIAFLILLLYLVYMNRVKMLIRKRKEEELNKRLAESSLISLKAQMNPHFMFNAMNSVQSLILKDKKEQAYSYLTKVSKLIRKSLEASDKTWIYLDEEVLNISNYLDLEKLRFSSNFHYDIQMQNTLDSIKIPTMIIQPFVENAVKHGLLHKEKGKIKKITIKFEQKEDILFCAIKDNGVGRLASKKINENNGKHSSFSTKVIEDRFQLLNECLNINVGFEYIDLVDANNASVGTIVTLKIPYILDED